MAGPQLAELGAAVRALRKPLSVVDGSRIAEDNTYRALAAKARALMTQNDPDAIRAGLAEIADALDPPSVSTNGSLPETDTLPISDSF